MLLAITLLLLALPAGVSARTDADRSWIVQLRSGTDVGRQLRQARDRLGIRPERAFQRALRGYSARMTAAQREALLADPNVLAVVPDEAVELAAQSVPAGISRVGANPSAIRAIDGSNPALDVDIAIIDTGIDPLHPDLNVAGGYDCTTTNTAAWHDEHSHGTHVAGAAAARDNDLGVVGVAPGARVWAVKVMDEDGVGLVSWLICGLDWVSQQRDPADSAAPLFEVANMSLSVFSSDDGNCGVTNIPTAYDLLHQAVCRLNREGVTNVVAAGNNSENAANRTPAAYGEVITVGAICDSDGLPGAKGAACRTGSPDDAWASFSNYGPAVDLVAPGVRIYSTMPGGGYGYKDGTSLATPHAAGGAALHYLAERAANRGRPTPEDVRAALIASGSNDWRRATYPLGEAKAPPLLDVASLAPAAGFRIGATPGSRLAATGQQVFFDVWLGRFGGFDGPVAISLSGLPGGSSWSLAGSPAVAANGDGWQRLTVNLPTSSPGGTFSVTINGSATSLASQSATVTIQLEPSLVAGSIPRLNLRPVVVSDVALPALVKWTSTSGADQYELQASRDGEPWQLVVRKAGLKHKVLAWPGATYRYRVRARTNGQWRTWRTSYAYAATPEMGNDTHAVLIGSWQYETIGNAYSEKVSYSNQAGARARLDFTGRSVSWIATKGPTRGRARVYIDGRLATTIDLYASSARHRQTVYRRSWPNPGAHRIEIEVVGTAGRPRVDVDALVYISAE